MTQTKGLLDVPPKESVEFERNTIRTAVCEVRFPTILDLETKPPSALQKLLRREYPNYEVHERADFALMEKLPGHIRYVFADRKGKWTVSLSSQTLSLETVAYRNFEDFIERLSSLLSNASELIDSDFFTRVGVRYINHIPVNDGELRGWINDSLYSSSSIEALGRLSRFECAYRGETKSGFYTFKHGINGIEDSRITSYLLDFDYFAEDVQANDALALAREFNSQHFSFFMWTIGAKTLKFMGQEKPKK